MNVLSNNFDDISSRSFNRSEVKELLRHLIESNIAREEFYQSEHSAQRCKDLSQTIKDALKSLRYDRYKYVIQVIIGEDDEHLMMTCRCLWDVERDNYTSHVYSNTKIFCAVTVFALAYS